MKIFNWLVGQMQHLPKTKVELVNAVFARSTTAGPSPLFSGVLPILSWVRWSSLCTAIGVFPLLGVFGLTSVAFGVIPDGRASPEHSSYLRRMAAVAFLFVVLQGMEPDAERATTTGTSMRNKLAVSLVCGRTSSLSRALEITMVVEVKRGRSTWLGLADRVCAYQRWSLRWSNGACICNSEPAVAVWPSLLMAEGQPPLFLPAMLPLGR